jgi:hypothetical protein
MKKLILTGMIACFALSVPAQTVAPSAKADASVTCADGTRSVATAIGPTSSVVAKCDKTGRSKSAVKHAASKKKVVENTTRQGSVALAAFAPAPGYAEEGMVYSDTAGNTFERHKGGDRLCRFYVNGELRKEQFVSGSSLVETKRMCDILAEVFQASLTPMTPEVTVISTAR